MTRVAAIDCGTNSIRLLVTDLADDGMSKRDLVREMRIVRLGHGIDRSGRIDDDALTRTFAASDEYAGLIADHDVRAVRFCATSATRDADNAEVFLDGVRERFGTTPYVLNGYDEAMLSFAGAARELPESPDPMLVVDLGGGSTELVVGSDGSPEDAASLDIGSVRLTERYLGGDPPTPEQIDACARDVDTVLDTVLDSGRIDLSAVRTVTGVAGTITTLAAHALGLRTYDPSRLHHARIGFAELEASCDAILAAPVAERRAMPFMHPGRADVIGGGALIVKRILARLGAADPVLLVSEHDILDGIAWSLQ